DTELADIPVVLISVLEHEELGLALGAAGYLTKPVERDRLVRVLAPYLPAGRSTSVLVVEDDPSTQQVITRILERHGCVVHVAGNGREALERMRAAAPQLILLDLVMPEMDGFEFVQHLRRHPAWHAIPVVVITSKDMTAEDHERLAGRVGKVLVKGSFTKDELLREIRAAVALPARTAD
ncbi:MAG TPA: response regulator, partial [Gemmatimonadota bacterium]|nr:response regulator [Gemmatimonadota bacterium]